MTDDGEIISEEIIILNEENIPELMERTGLSQMILHWRLYEDRRKGVKSAYFLTIRKPSE